MPTLDSDGCAIYYETHGQGPPLVLIHAISAGAGMWKAQVERFSRDHEVIVFDARGVDRSGRTRRLRHLRDQMAGDVVNLLTHLGYERATVCGVSFGGVIAQHFAARYPEKVEGLVIVDSYSDTRPNSPTKALWLASVFTGSVSNFLPRQILVRVIRRTYRRWPLAVDSITPAVKRLRSVDAWRTRVAVTLVNYPPALNAASYPILAVVGENSWPRSLTFMQELKTAVERTRLVRIADSNDPTPLCQPEAFNRALGSFLKQHRDRSD